MRLQLAVARDDFELKRQFYGLVFSSSRKLATICGKMSLGALIPTYAIFVQHVTHLNNLGFHLKI